MESSLSALASLLQRPTRATSNRSVVRSTLPEELHLDAESQATQPLRDAALDSSGDGRELEYLVTLRRAASSLDRRAPHKLRPPARIAAPAAVCLVIACIVYTGRHRADAPARSLDTLRAYNASAPGGMGMPRSAVEYDGLEDKRPISVEASITSGDVHVFVVGGWAAPAGHQTAEGDEAKGGSVAKAMKSLARSLNPQYILNVGDSLYSGGIQVDCQRPPSDATGQASKDFKSGWKSVYGELTEKPWLSTLGDHDYGQFGFGQGWPQLIGYSFVDPNWILPARYYTKRVQHPGSFLSSFTVDYFVFDSNAFDTRNSMQSVCSSGSQSGTCTGVDGLSLPSCIQWFWDSYSKQKAWLEEKLAASDADWKVVVTHWPCGHDTDFWMKMHEEHGLDLLVTGHMEQQELWYDGTSSEYIKGQMRQHGWSGLVCLVSGGGGGGSEPKEISERVLQGTAKEEIRYGQDLNDRGFFDLAISKDRMHIELIAASALGQGNLTLLPKRKTGAVVDLPTTTTTTTTSTTPNVTTSKVAVPQSPTFEWYTYRAVPEDAFTKYGFGDTNTANADGVMWYLTNEVVTMYTAGSRCPRKFDISKIMRFKVRTKATPEMHATGMNFGARFAFDFGKCMGRCFSHNLCTGEEDCKQQYSKYGNVVGCNNFWDHSVYPDYDTSAPNGVWYTFPKEGKCDEPTGEHDCTWSVERAGEVTLGELEAIKSAPPGEGNCCNEHCSFFWDGVLETGMTAYRSQQLVALFARKYPNMTPQLNPPFCDFQAQKWYWGDAWPRKDPWAKNETSAEGWEKHEGVNCFNGLGAQNMDGTLDPFPGSFTVQTCQQACEDNDGCQGVVIPKAEHYCFLRRDIELRWCQHGTSYDLYMKASKAKA